MPSWPVPCAAHRAHGAPCRDRLSVSLLLRAVRLIDESHAIVSGSAALGLAPRPGQPDSVAIYPGRSREEQYRSLRDQLRRLCASLAAGRCEAGDHAEQAWSDDGDDDRDRD